jgi:hypothetical protein
VRDLSGSTYFIIPFLVRSRVGLAREAGGGDNLLTIVKGGIGIYSAWDVSSAGDSQHQVCRTRSALAPPCEESCRDSARCYTTRIVHGLSFSFVPLGQVLMHVGCASS